MANKNQHNKKKTFVKEENAIILEFDLVQNFGKILNFYYYIICNEYIKVHNN